MIVTVYGVGEVGSTLASLLSSHLTNSVINLVDTSGEISGRILDLQHAACLNSNEVVFNRPDKLEISNYVFFCAGVRSRKNSDRNSIAAKNKELVRSVFDTCVFKTNTTVIVMSNPVDLVSEWISEFCGNSALVIGTGTSIDTGRLNFLLCRETGQPPNKVQALVLGEHGEQMVPVFSRCSINGRPVGDFLSVKKMDALSLELVNSARSIRRTETATKYGIAGCALRIMQGLIGSESMPIPLSVPINNYFKKLLDIRDDLYFSLPCTIGNGSFQIQNIDGFSQIEVGKLRKSAQNIKKVYRSVK